MLGDLIKRKIYETLLEWKNQKHHKPLLIKGPRQVGKTYIIDKFCNENYKQVFKFDLIKDNTLIEIFNQGKTFDMKLNELELLCGSKLNSPDTVIFIDEIQKSEKLIEALKYFYDSENDYNIICAGSLLGVALNRMKSSFPVGKVIEKTLYSMSFEEFLMATGNERYISEIKEHYETNTPMPTTIHTILIDLVQRYMCLGGMPSIINEYIDNNQELLLVDKEMHKSIIEQYFEDMKECNTLKEQIRTKRIYEDIPIQLGKENQKFTYSHIDKTDNRKSNYITAFDWLVCSSLILISNTLEVPKIPLKTNIISNYYKLYLGDVGLLMSLSNTPYKMIFSSSDYSYKGVISENYVACELSRNDFDLFYWSRKGKNKGNAEIDFVIQDGLDAIPIEVKASDNTKSKSLEVYMNEYEPNYAIRISLKNFGFENNIKSVPLYSVFCIKESE